MGKKKTMSRFPANILLDTGYWIALCDAREGFHGEAADKFERFEGLGVILPWPCMYETCKTRFVRNGRAMRLFAQIVRGSRIQKVDDHRYRENAYDLTMETFAKRPTSLVDMVIRLMLDNVVLRVDGLLTTNPGDFNDVCRKRKIDMP